MTRPTTTGKAQDLITFTRSTTGTYLGSDGLLKSAAIDEARIEYDASGNCLGLLVEEEKTNLLAYSAVTEGGWGQSGSTNTNRNDNVLGVFSGLNVVSNGQTWNRATIGATLVSGNTYATTVFYKEGTAENVRITCRANGAESTIGGQAGSLNVGGEYAGPLTLLNEEDYGGIRKVTFLWVPGSSSGVSFGIGPNSDVSGESVIAYGAQIESGSFPTSYIPTSGSAATRADDLASLAVSKFGYNQDQCSVVVESNFFGGTNTSALCYIGEDTSDRIVLYYSNQNLSFQVKSSGATQASKSLSGQRNKAAYRYKLNDMNLAGNGDTTVADTSANLLGGTQDNIYIGSYYHNAGAHLNGHIKSIKYYPVGLSNAQLQALTV